MVAARIVPSVYRVIIVILCQRVRNNYLIYLLAFFTQPTLTELCDRCVLSLWTPAQRSLSYVHVMFCECYFSIYFLWPPYAPAQVNGGSRKFYTWWTLSVNREVTTWIFSWSSLNYRVDQKVTKFGIFSDPARKFSALTPE